MQVHCFLFGAEEGAKLHAWCTSRCLASMGEPNKGFTKKLPKLDLTTDIEYAVNSVNVNIWLLTCNREVYYMGCYTCTTIFFLLISYAMTG